MRLRKQYHELVSVVAAEAMRNQAFYNSISAQMTVPGNDWSLHMCSRQRTRLDDTILRFDASAGNRVGHYTVINTAKLLFDLVTAIKSLAKPVNWRMMDSTTRLQYFGLVLDILLNITARDNDRRPARSSPYTAETAKDHNLYLQMIGSGKCAHVMYMLHDLFVRLRAPLAQNQTEQIRALVAEAEAKHDRYRKSRVPGVPDTSNDFTVRVRNLYAGKLTGCCCCCSTQTNMVPTAVFPRQRQS